MQLRDYQRAAIDGLYKFWDGGGGNALLDVPTGAGKSFIAAAFMQEAISEWGDTRILSVTHVKELIRQNYDELLTIWPWAPCGIYSAGIGQRNTWSQIIFCGIASVYRRAHEFGEIDLLIVDEVHLVPRNSSTMYRQFIQQLQMANPAIKVVGLTATPFRLDSGRLNSGDGALFDGVAYSVPVRELIDDGFLAPLVSKGMETVIDLTGVKKRGGEYAAGDLQRACDKTAITEAAITEIEAYGQDRKGWLIFCTGVEHAQHVAQSLERRGYSAETITADTPKGERDEIVTRYKAGGIRALASVGVLTTGFNARHVDLIAFLRPTLSTGLYIQMAGRGMRTYPAKQNCLILDFAGNVRRHGPVDDPDIKEPGKGDGEAPVKECPDCHSLVHAGFRHCPDCGYFFPPDEIPKITPTADTLPILSVRKPQWQPVQCWAIHMHKRDPNKLPTLRVEYTCGLTVHKEWICFEHEGYASEKGRRWWLEQGGKQPAPLTVLDAWVRYDELTCPSDILIQRDGKFFKIMGRRLKVAA